MLFTDDKSMPDDWKPKRVWELGQEALAKFGRISPTAEWLEKLLVDAGFVDVQVCCKEVFLV